MGKLKLLSLFAGCGAPERALDRLKIPYEIVGFSEIDKYAIQAYKALNGDVPSLGDVTQVDFTKIDTRGGIDLVIGGFPCQAFSIAGKRAGFDDLRGTMCFYMANAIKELKPKYFLFENVYGLLTHDKGKTIRIILEVFSGLGYEITMDVLNAKDYLVPQNRNRIFCLGRLAEGSSCSSDITVTNKRCKEILEELESQGKIRVWKDYAFPEPKPLQKRLKDILEEKVDEKYYLSEKAIAGFKKHNINHEAKGTGFIWKPKTGEDIVNCLRANMHKNCPTDNYIIEEGNIYPNSGNPQAGRIYNSDGISPCLDTCSGGNRMPKIVEEPLIAASRGRYQEDGSTEQQLEINETGCANTLTTVQKDNLVVENRLRIRRLTPKECWRLMAFTDEEFDKVQATGISNTQLYKMAGNSIVVNCLIALFFNLLLKK